MKGATRKPLTAEDRWFEAAAEALHAERDKLQVETELLRYEVMELRTWERARRTYDLTVDVSEESARDVIATLSDWAAESAERITVRMVCPGGDVVAGLAIYDFIIGLRREGTPIDTLALGWAASMGSVLLQAGERRYIAPNASVLIHESRTVNSDDSTWAEKISDAADRLRWEQDLDRRCDAILAERSVLSVRDLRARYARKDWWLTARECVAYGFVDSLWRPRRRAS